MKADLVAALLASAGVAALVSTDIYWGVRPQGCPTASLRLNLVYPGVDQTLDAPMTTTQPLVQVDCFGADYDAADALASAVRAAVTALANPPFQGGFLVGERYLFDRPDGPDVAGAPETHLISLDFELTHTPA
jgi:hypothetical protein